MSFSLKEQTYAFCDLCFRRCGPGVRKRYSGGQVGKALLNGLQRPDDPRLRSLTRSLLQEGTAYGWLLCRFCAELVDAHLPCDLCGRDMRDKGGLRKSYSAEQRAEAELNGLLPIDLPRVETTVLFGGVFFHVEAKFGLDVCPSCAVVVDARLAPVPKTATFYGHTEEEAKAKAYAAGIPEERVIKMEVTPVTERQSEDSGPDPERAIEAAKRLVPESAFDVASPEITKKGERGQCEMRVPTWVEAFQGWKREAPDDAIFDKYECLVPPKSGLLGIGKEPGLWKISWKTPTQARVRYKLPAEVTLTYLAQAAAREEKPRMVAEVVRCSTCSNELERLDVGIAENIPDLQQWHGNVCLRCQRVYCSKCLELGGPTPCPHCGEPTKPAQRLHLHAISAFNRPRPDKAAGSEAGPREFKLLAIGQEFLSSDFSTPEEPAGAGAASFQEAIQASNRQEFQKAEEAFKRAVVEGLPPTCESYANCRLGILALRRGQLDPGVDYLLRCLCAKEKSANSAWEASVRLKIIYAEAGRTEEANTLADLATTANTRGLELEPQAEEELRKLVRVQRK